MLQRRKAKEGYVVRHEEFIWKTNDGKNLFAQCWDAGPACKAVILLVHGLGEHSSRYEHWAGKFVGEGISVLSFDLRGHGKTPVNISNASNYNKLLGDIDILVTKSKDMFPEVPAFLYGHSFGGNLVVNYIISQQINLKGIILTSPWLELAQLPPRIKTLAGGILSRFAPGLKARTGLRPEDMSRELRQVHHYRNDPKVHGFINVRLFMQAYEQGLVAKRSIYKINQPLLVIHGSADKITSCSATREFVMNCGEKTSFYEIEGGYHELHNDSDSQNVFDLIHSWITKNISS